MEVPIRGARVFTPLEPQLPYPSALLENAPTTTEASRQRGGRGRMRADTFRGPGAGTARLARASCDNAAPPPAYFHSIRVCAASGWEAATEEPPGAKSMTKKGGGPRRALIDGPGAWPRRGYGV